LRAGHWSRSASGFISSICKDFYPFLVNFINNQENNNFNGELLTKTTIKTLLMMGINSNIQQKKFMAWIERGFAGFNDYLFNSNMDK